MVPMISPGLRIRTTRRLHWVHANEWILIPAGTEGVIGFWKPFEQGRSAKGMGSSILFDGLTHPEFNGFPMARRDMGDRLPDSMEPVRAERMAA